MDSDNESKQVDQEVKIRPIKKNEIPLLTEFLYEAIYQNPDVPPIPRTVLQRPQVFAYVDGFGTKPDDYALVADAGVVVGAVWVRSVSAFGNEKDGMPEFAIALYPEYRSKGIGTRLIFGMLELLKENGYKKASLAVQKENYALRLYQKAGFKTVGESALEYVMERDLL